MADNRELYLDQLWFTSSTSGLGNIGIGFRVRAASEGFDDMYYRRVSRVLDYELPQGVSASEFSTTIAPVSLALVNNGEERLLIRKVYIGQDIAGRHGNFFTHLIAGLPHTFTARDAIHLWYCPDLWVESEAGKASSDTNLKKIPYSTLRSYADHPQAGFNVASVSEPLRNLLLLILTSGLPEHIEIRGHSTLIATLIYGLTHALPMKLLPDLTFTTYVKETQKRETLITGTINGAELQDRIGIQVQLVLPAGPVPEELQRYVDTAIDVLVTDIQSERFFKLIDEIDSRDRASVEDLIKLFKRRFKIGPFTVKQLEDMLLYPDEYSEELVDPAFQDQAVRLLLDDPVYWESRGQKIFQNIQEWLISSEQSRRNKQGREAMVNCLDGMVERLYATIQAEVSKGQLPARSAAVLVALQHPTTHRGVYQRMLVEFAHKPLYKKIRTDAMWSFQLWLLNCANRMLPLPNLDDIHPWLQISSWNNLIDVLKFNPPAEWEDEAIYTLLSTNREIPKPAYRLVMTHEAKFIRAIRTLMIQGSKKGQQEYTDAALRLFAAIIRFEEQDHSYLNRVGLLLALMNAVPEDTKVIEALFATVPFASPYQLTMQEFDRVVAGCRPEVIAAGGASPSLMKYLNEYVLALTPKKLNPNTVKLLEQFQHTSATLPEGTARFVKAWLDMHAFLTSQHFDDKKLRKIEPALATLVPLLQQRGQDIWQIFIQELAPYLASMIENEHQLEEVLDVFEGASIVRPWDLLNALTVHVGKTYTEDQVLSRLFPYIIVGMREYINAGEQASALDAYCKSLFIGVNENVLGEVDNAILSGVWAEPIQKEWLGWHERNKPFLGELAKSMLSSQPSKSQSAPKPITWQLPRLSRPTIDLSSELQAASTSNQPSQVWQTSGQQQRNKDTQLLKNAPGIQRFSISTRGGKYACYDDVYQQYHRTLCVVLPYWIIVIHTYNKMSNDSLQSEEITMRSLLEELQRLSPQTTSMRLVQILVDDLLIQLEIDRMRDKGDQNVDNFLNPVNYIPTRLQDFQATVGEPEFRSISANYSEQAIKEVLSHLISRYHFILRLNENSSGGSEKWIEKERKRVKVDFTKLD